MEASWRPVPRGAGLKLWLPQQPRHQRVLPILIGHRELARLYPGQRPSRSSRKHRAISCTQRSSVGPTAVHSRDRLPTMGVSLGSKANMLYSFDSGSSIG